MNPYTTYYVRQAQSGFGSRYNQQQTGHGLGNIISSVFRTVFPYVKSGLSALKDELLSGGVGVLSDTFHQVPLNESLTNRVRNFGTGLTERAVRKVSAMTGSGAQKRGVKRKRNQSGVRRKGRRTATKKGPKKPRKKTKKPVKRLKPKRTGGNKKKPKKRTRKVSPNTVDIFG